MSNECNVTSVGIIMDGNRRWAKARNMPAKFGHSEGANTVREICKAASEIGIKYLTLYAFSTENWKRDKEEVDEIMRLLREFLDECIGKLGSEDARVVFIGDRTRLEEDMIEKMDTLEKETAENPGLTVAIAINYGGRDEIVRAIKRLHNDNIDFNQLNEEMFSKYLDTKDVVDPEIIIRTSGEMRLSNFLIWQSAYSELFFSEKMWPEFQKQDLEEILEKFNNRNRRFGGK